MDNFEKLRTKWNEMLIGSNDYGQPSKEEQETIDKVDKTTEELVETFNYNNPSCIWEDLSDFDVTQTQTDCYRRILDITMSYSMKASKYYKDPQTLNVILQALRFVNEKAYNIEASPYYGNWWNWEIGNPILLGKIMSLLGDSLPEDERDLYNETIKFYQPDPRYSGLRVRDNGTVQYRKSLGANRIDTAKVALLLGINMEDEEQVTMARDSISDTLVIIDEDPNFENTNGLYKDGSYVQHVDVPYIGTYGNVFLGGLGQIINALNDTPWEVKDPNINNIYNMILESFQPFVYKGHAMDCVNGRGASREEWSNNRTGHAIINSILWFAKFAPKEYADKYKSMVKYWILEDQVRDYIKSNNNLNSINMAKEILEDDSIVPRGPLIGSYAFDNMDRLVHRMPKYSAALAMYSKRIRSYEHMLGENEKGFYTSDGMLYIYNGDQKEYNDNYWPTVDPYKLTGITLDTKKLEDKDGYYRSPEAWVSSMTHDNKIGLAGMQLNKEKYDPVTKEITNPLDIDLKAKKSYFFLQEEIVALGSDINTSKDRDVKTIIDTRKISNDLTNKVLMEDKYIYFQGNKDYTMGYYILDGNTVHEEKYLRKASWYDVNKNASKDIKEQGYLSLYINHGKAPQAESYAYIMAPNVQKEDLKDYPVKRHIELLENTKNIQAIRHKDILMANFWKDGDSKIDKVRVSKKASLILEDKDNILKLAISDPTKENENYIDLEISASGSEVLEKSDEIEVKSLEGKISLRVNTKNTRGAKLTISIKK